VRDVKDIVNDTKMARHIVGLHSRAIVDSSLEKAHFDLNELRNYILYAKMSCNPRLNEEAAVTL
jgi:DNA replicative helicase MCM subunit Mcm2 (Cdc46/Mcm family)